MTPDIAMVLVWMGWVVSWLAAAAWSRRTEARPVLGAQLTYRVVTGLGVLLLFPRTPWARNWPRLWEPAPIQWGLVGAAVAGFAFCWWARLHLGTLSSSSVSRKADHRIVDTGPYALVRHPIYTGLIVAAAAAAALTGTPASLAGFALFAVGCWMKARLEERFLRAELGAASYDAYARRTRMLLPFL